MFLQSTLPLAANVGSRQFFSGGLHALVQALRWKAQDNGSERTFSVKLEPVPSAISPAVLTCTQNRPRLDKAV
jgi:hypothetical protein